MNLTHNPTSTICFYLIITRWLNPNQVIRVLLIFNYFDKINKYFSATAASVCSKIPKIFSAFISHIFSHNSLTENHLGKQTLSLIPKIIHIQKHPLNKDKLTSILPVSVYNTQWKSKSKLAAGCSKHCFEVVDRTDRVSIIYLRQGVVDVVWRDFRRV